jgi:TetR/AcrR family transcriptional regulator, ethionamide resistance regulator
MPTRSREAQRSTRQETRERIIATATELMRRRSYSDLSVGELMREAGFGDTGRTIFYRHFDDLGDLLVQASREAIDALYAAQRPSEDPVAGSVRDVVRPAIERAVDVYRQHGPLLRAVIEAAASDPQVAAGHSAMRRQFDGLVESAMRERGMDLAHLAETARALNILNEAYLVDAFGREERVSRKVAVETLTQIWMGVLS